MQIKYVKWPWPSLGLANYAFYFIILPKCYAPILAIWPIIPNVLLIMLEVFHIHLTTLVDNTKLWDKKLFIESYTAV